MSISDLDRKITYSSKIDFERLQSVSLYAHDSAEADVKNLKSLEVDSSGNLKMTGEVSLASGHGLATENKQDTMISELQNMSVKCLGNTEGDGSGDTKHIHLDGNGNVNSQIINTVSVNAFRTNISDGSTNSHALVQADGSQVCLMKGNDGVSDRTVKTDGNGALIVDASKEGMVNVNGTTTALHTMLLASNDTVNLRTLSCNDDGRLDITNDTLTYQVDTLLNNVNIPDGNSQNTSVFDLGSKIHASRLGNLEFFVDNSASAPIRIKAIVSPDDGLKYYDNVNGLDINTSGGAVNFTQEDIMSMGNKYFLLQITNNHGGGVATDITVRVGYYQ